MRPSPGATRPSDPAFGDPFRPARRATRVVQVGDVAIGGEHPIRIQSMTNTDTMDTAATVEQSVRLAEAGCEIVRVTAPSIRDAENLREIRKALDARGVRVPLVADIHFTPNAALIAADVVEKVRINPGNYADKKKFEVREYDDAQYRAEIERVAERFRPLVQRCKRNGVAMRIGTNHGSLSDRILNRFGDTPEGMVESALEFLDVCEDEGYHEIVFSMKASNTQVAIQAYRLLATRLEARAPGEPSYPFHVGVTEAGDAEDGRIKSAIGIGALLEDGLGDTIRVSLTEDPVREVPVAREIVRQAAAWSRHAASPPAPRPAVAASPLLDPFGFARRASRSLEAGGLSFGGDAPVRVELDAPDALNDPATFAARLATDLSGLKEVACEALRVDAVGDETAKRLTRLRGELASLGVDLPLVLAADAAEGFGPLPDDLTRLGLARLVVPRHGAGRDVSDPQTGSLGPWLAAATSNGVPIEWALDGPAAGLPEAVGAALKQVPAPASVFSLGPEAPLQDVRVLVSALRDRGVDADRAPIVLRHAIVAGARPAGLRLAGEGITESELVRASIRLGGLLCDGIGDLLSIRSGQGAAAAVDLAYRILQGARLRTTRTEYISCPSCGRTLFDLEETTARIKAKTGHLRGVKIAVMGCIVNGPGEMADADFGYVGSGVGQVTLYVGQEIVARAVPEAEAPDRLVELIQAHGRWALPDAAGRGLEAAANDQATGA